MRINTARLRRLRRAQGWTQTALAARADVHPSTVNRLEHGRPASPASVKSVADALGVTVDDLAAPDDEPDVAA